MLGVDEMDTREYWLSRKFSDNKRFPYGFSKSGDFTLAESALLESNGQLISALLEDQVNNPNATDKKLLKAILSGAAESTNDIARVWLKYQRINHARVSLVTTKVRDESTEDDDYDDDIDD